MLTHSGKRPFPCTQCSASFHNHPASNVRWEHTAIVNILSVVNVGKILPAAQTVKDICKLTVEKNIPVLNVGKHVHIHLASRHTWQHTQARSHLLVLSVAKHLLNPVNLKHTCTFILDKNYLHVVSARKHSFCLLIWSVIWTHIVARNILCIQNAASSDITFLLKSNHHSITLVPITYFDRQPLHVALGCYQYYLEQGTGGMSAPVWVPVLVKTESTSF